MPRPAALAPSTRAGAVDGQQRPALVAAGARLDRANLGQVIVKGLSEIDLGLIQRALFDPTRADPVGRCSVGPDRLTSSTSTTLGSV